MGSDAKVCSMRRRVFSLIRVRARPGSPTRGILLAGPLALPVVLGRGGIRANKFEGDGATPRGRFRPIRLWWRADRHWHPPTLLPARRITPDLAWCEDTTDRRYNRPFRRATSDGGDRLWRTDHLYDFIVEIDHNTRPRAAWRSRRTTCDVCLRPLGRRRESQFNIRPEFRPARPLRRRSRCRPAHGWRRTRWRAGNPRSCPWTTARGRCAARSWRSGRSAAPAVHAPAEGT